MDGVQRELRAYYEDEAQLRLRRPPLAQRVALRDEFVAMLVAEGRRSIVEFGAGPGLDLEAMADAAAPISAVGLDLAHGNAVLAAERGVPVVQASLDAPPFRPASFDAGWSMSTLMHVPDDDVEGAVTGMAAVLRPGAPFVIGVWGGGQGDVVIDDPTLPGRTRYFGLRTLAANHDALAAVGDVEHRETWDFGPERWEYQIFRLRIRR